MLGIEAIVDVGMKLIDRIIPNPEARAEAQARLLELQQNGELKLEEFEVKREEIAASDRNSARAREMHLKDSTPTILASLITIGFFTILGYMLTEGMPENGKDALLIMLGALGSAWTGVVAYYFGSSAGSRDKDHTIHNMGKK
jgi:hypothetical protein